MKRVWVALIGLLMLALLAAPSALADSSTDLANKIGNVHVYVEPDASPKLEGADQVSQQVDDTEQALNSQLDARSPLKGIFIINITDNSVTPDSLRQALADKHGGFSGAIVVINHHGYQHAAYNVSKGWAAANNVLFDQARDAHRGDVYGTITGYLVLVKSVTPDWVPPAPPPHQPADLSGLWTFLGWTFALLLVVLVVWSLVVIGRHRREREADRHDINDRLVGTETSLTSLSSDVLNPNAPDVSRYHGLATTLYGSARDARDSGDYYMADSYLRQAERQIGYADALLHPDARKVKETPKKERQWARVSATDTDGKQVKVRNDDYSRSRHGNYQYAYQGGMHDGVFFYPGYYPYPFWMYTWAPSDVVIDGSTALPDHWDGNYTSNYASSGAQVSDFVFSPTPTATHSSGSSSSGFDSGSSTPAPSHHSSSSPSYDSGSSSSSFGGGFDGGSFGGGGFDSGSSSSGF